MMRPDDRQLVERFAATLGSKLLIQSVHYVPLSSTDGTINLIVTSTALARLSISFVSGCDDLAAFLWLLAIDEGDSLAKEVADANIQLAVVKSDWEQSRYSITRLNEQLRHVTTEDLRAQSELLI